MRVLTPFLALLAAACSGAAPPVTTASRAAPPCVLPAGDSLWLRRAIGSWRDIGERVLQLETRPLPPLLLFDTRCAYDVTVGESWSVTGAPHGGRVVLPNLRVITPVGIGITSPARHDSSLFLALALPDVWLADPRYAVAGDSRQGWEEYLVGAFSHEMAHARMLPVFLPRLRALEAAIYPDTMEDNLVQNRFARDREFAATVAREISLLERAWRTRNPVSRVEYARAALGLMRERRAKRYVGDLAAWGDVEQAFLDLEGVAQWTALYVRSGGTRLPTGAALERLLARFRSSREFWSEDEGLVLVLVLDQLVPGWQRQLIAEGRTGFELLARAVGLAD